MRCNKTFAIKLTLRICIGYFALAASLTALQIYLMGDPTAFDILMLAAGCVLATAGLGVVTLFFANRLVTNPVQRFIAQIKPSHLAEVISMPPINMGSTTSKELTELRDKYDELTQSVAIKHAKLQKDTEEAVVKAKSKFLATASHDLRQPMHALNLYLGSLSELDNLPQPVQTYVDNLNKCARAMNDMLDTLLEISKIDAGATQVRRSVFPIASPIELIEAEFAPLARAKGVTLRVARCSAFVDTDEEIVERILRNLVSNAVRYTEHGKVLIGCRRRGGHLRVAVHDTGLGLAADIQQAIFEEQFQLNNYVRNRAKGLGFGLTIVHRLTKLLGTSITLNSKPGAGSTFAFDVPLMDLRSVRPVTPDLSDDLDITLNHRLPRDLKILVIDDEPLIIDATRTLLEGWGYTVITAVNGQDALKKVVMAECTPDFIICDYLLNEGESGTMVINSLRSAFNKEIPACLVSGITLPEHIETVRASGLEFMYKPLDHEKLREALSRFIPLSQ